MSRRLPVTVLAVFLSLQAQAGDNITREHIQKVIQFPHDKWMATVRLDKQEYLELIDEGWPTIEEYEYHRDGTVIHVMPDGLSGRSYSTITETLILDGTRRVSKFREHALYALENGRPVITQISGHTLVGDTMPE